MRPFFFDPVSLFARKYKQMDRWINSKVKDVQESFGYLTLIAKFWKYLMINPESMMSIVVYDHELEMFTSTTRLVL